MSYAYKIYFTYEANLTSSGNVWQVLDKTDGFASGKIKLLIKILKNETKININE